MTRPAVRLLEPGDEPALEAFLLAHLDSSMFLLSNARSAGLVDRGQYLQGSYVAAFEGREIAGVVGHFWNGNLLLQAPACLEALLQAAISASGRPVAGILGPEEQVRRAMTLLNIKRTQLQMDEPEVLYGLALANLIMPEMLRSGQVRARLMETKDLERQTAWRVAYSIEAIHDPDSPQLWEHSRAGVARHLANKTTWILEAGGQPVATTSFNARLPEIVQVGGVYTPPAWRGRGYARAAVAASLLAARSGGVRRAILFTGQENHPARKAYEAIGFRPVGNYYIALLHEPGLT